MRVRKYINTLSLITGLLLVATLPAPAQSPAPGLVGILGSRNLPLKLRVQRAANDLSIAKRLDLLQIPQEIELSSITIESGVLGTQVTLSLRDTSEDQPKTVRVAGTSLFSPSVDSKVQELRFQADLTPSFDFGRDTEMGGTIKFVLTLEFSTDANVSSIQNPRLSITRIYRVDPDDFRHLPDFVDEDKRETVALYQ